MRGFLGLQRILRSAPGIYVVDKAPSPEDRSEHPPHGKQALTGYVVHE